MDNIIQKFSLRMETFLDLNRGIDEEGEWLVFGGVCHLLFLFSVILLNLAPFSASQGFFYYLCDFQVRLKGQFTHKWKLLLFTYPCDFISSVQYKIIHFGDYIQTFCFKTTWKSTIKATIFKVFWSCMIILCKEWTEISQYSFKILTPLSALVMSSVWINCSFIADLSIESIDLVHKNSLNDSFTNWTDPVLELMLTTVIMKFKLTIVCFYGLLQYLLKQIECIIIFLAFIIFMCH